MKIVKYLLAVVSVLIIIFVVICCVISFISVPEIKDFKKSTFIVDKPVEEMTDEELFSIPVVKKYADEGDIGAQYVYGYCLLFGRGITQDKEEAVKWLRKSADKNFAYAQAMMAYCYLGGEGVSQDKEEAHKWAVKSEENGYSIWDCWDRWENYPE